MTDPPEDILLTAEQAATCTAINVTAALDPTDA
jgi:phage-related baseplate assembly protein